METLASRKIIGAVFFIAFLFAVTFQNCAPVSFQSSKSESKEQGKVERQREASQPSGPSNGDAYSGKITSFVHWSLPGECGAVEIQEKSVIRYDERDYFLVKENCVERVPKPLSNVDILVTGDGRIRYQDEDFSKVWPTSCQEIFDSHGSNGNGVYFIDPDGPGLEDPFSLYCDMDFIGQGWTPWSDWSECSSECGPGEQTRERNCVTGACQGESQEVRVCERDPC